MKIVLHELIVEYMLKKRYSVEKFCKKCKISKDTFFIIFNKNLNFDIVEIFKILKALKMDFNKILN